MDGTILAKKYNLMNGGGGGTDVIANPEGEATADLNKLQIENDVYQIPATPPFAVKTKKYTGTGTTSIQHDFGTETPKVIFGISIDPEYNNGNADFATIQTFPWGCKLTAMNWSVGTNNVPNAGGNGGGWRVAVAYTGNKMTVTARDAGAACNRADVEYVIWYI